MTWSRDTEDALHTFSLVKGLTTSKVVSETTSLPLIHKGTRPLKLVMTDMRRMIISVNYDM